MTQVPPDHSARSCDVTELAGIVRPPGGWSLCLRRPKEEAGGRGRHPELQGQRGGSGACGTAAPVGSGEGTALGVHGLLPDALELRSPP